MLGAEFVSCMASKTNSHLKLRVVIKKSSGLTINWFTSMMKKGRRLCSQAKKVLIAVYEYFAALEKHCAG